MDVGSAAASTAIFLATYALILSEKVHRTIAALTGGLAMICAGIGLGFYSWDEAIAAIDFNTLGLLLGMMILAELLQATGFFQYSAVKLAQLTRGNPWWLILGLGGFTASVSMVLDNVTTVLMVAPVSLSIAEVLGINPVPFLITEAVCSNVGGVATLVGDPPNILIGSAAGFSFTDFLVHLGPVVVVALLLSFGLFKLLFGRELQAPSDRLDLLMTMDPSKALLAPTARRMLLVVALTIALYLVHDRLYLPPGVVALVGAVLGLFASFQRIEDVLAAVHWDVLLFFMGLFVVVGGLEEAGVLSWISHHLGFLARTRLVLAATAILWVSALLSALVDNIPFTMAMLPVIKGFKMLGVPINPLWWALALGVGFGGNATPIGASANVVVVSISGRTDKPITVKDWLHSGTWLTLLECTVATIALILGVKFGWYS